MTREEALAELKDTIKGSYYQCRMEPMKWQSKHGTGGTVMTVIEFAEKRLNESCLNDDDEAVLYWRAYLDGARAQKKEVQ